MNSRVGTGDLMPTPSMRNIFIFYIFSDRVPSPWLLLRRGNKPLLLHGTLTGVASITSFHTE